MDEGYDPTYGARPLKRTIQRKLLDPLALLTPRRARSPTATRSGSGPPATDLSFDKA